MRSGRKKKALFAKRMQPRSAGSAGKEPRGLTQLVVSGMLFVALVAAKLLLPEQIAPAREMAVQLLEQNMDVKEVFSAVGRAFSGEGSLLDSVDSVYQAVFQPQSAEEVRGTDHEHTVPPTASDGGEFFEPVVGNAEDMVILDILYSRDNTPENAELQQVVLGFDYCAPVDGGNVSSSFGYRKDPAGEGSRFHYGLDITADAGSPVAAFADGTVAVVGESSSYGKYLVIDHADGCRTLYAHCSAIHVTSGQAVSLGDIVAQVGDTGQATGAHLHFELQRDGVYLNPVYYAA